MLCSVRVLISQRNVAAAVVVISRSIMEVESCRQQPTSGTGDHEHDADLISRLPDDVLGDVITLLPTNDGARTQLFSRRWRSLLRSAPLNLEGSVAGATDKHRLAAILRAHRCPARRVSITTTSELFHWSAAGLDDLLLRSPGLDSLQELELHNHAASNDRHCKSAPPAAAFRFSSTLRVITVRGGGGRGRLHEHLTGEVTDGALAFFPHLDRLTLESASTSRRCPVLRSLVLRHNAGHRRLRITSSTLRSLGVTADHRCPEPKLEGIVIENAPVLERLVLDGDGCFQIRVIQAPKLKVLGYIDAWNFKKMEFVGRLNDARRGVKILALIIPLVELLIILDILQCFPCVEKLHIIMLDWRMNSEHYHGYRDEVNLIRFFLLHARVLKSVKLVVSCHDKHDNKWFASQDKWFASQHKKIRPDHRDSQGAKFNFELDHPVEEEEEEPGHQKRPRGGGDDHGSSPGGGAPREDLICRLPDDVLRGVITRLPTRDGARTQVLSRRWRPLWRSSPLNLEVRAPLTLPAVDEHRAAAILAAHHVPARRFALAAWCWQEESLDGVAALDALLQHPGLDSLEELELSYYGARRRRPPPSVFRFSATLRVLSLCWNSCRREPLTVPVLDFPCLARLTLASLNISEATLEGILSRCHVLQSLALCYNVGYRRVQVRSSTLRSLGVRERDRFGEKAAFQGLVVENAPLLERIILDCSLYGWDLHVVHAPGLKILGDLNSCQGLPRIIIEPDAFSNSVLNDALRTVKILSLVSDPDLDLVLGFLCCFPCVETLYIKKKPIENVWHCTARKSLECLDAHLKTLHLAQYHGSWSEVNLVRFFLLNAGVLESIKLVVNRDKYDDKWVANQYMELQLDDGAFRGPKLDFEDDNFPPMHCYGSVTTSEPTSWPCGGCAGRRHGRDSDRRGLRAGGSAGEGRGTAPRTMGVVTRSKRRRLDDEESSRGQQLPPGGGGGGADHQEADPAAGADDLISRLPDDLLGDVITRLPTTDGARTQILSRRWRPLWRSTPLNLSATFDASADESRAVAALRAHPGPARRLHLAWRRHVHSVLPMVDDLLLRCPGVARLHELEMYYAPTFSSKVPASSFPLPRTLRVLVMFCSEDKPWRVEIVGGGGSSAASAFEFPHLRQLTLRHVRISEDHLHRILSRCPLLESLMLHRNVGYRLLRIRSLPQLRSLAVAEDAPLYEEEKLEQVVVEDAPLLEWLIPARHQARGLQIQVIHAPKLRVLGYLSDESMSKFEIAGTVVSKKLDVLDGSGPSVAMNTVNTVKILALQIAPNALDVVIDFLKCFPRVEKLYMEFTQKELKNVPTKNAHHRNAPIECLDAHLKTVELKCYQGRKSELSLIRFFLSKARVLESFKFIASRRTCDAKWIAKQRKKLLVNIRASQGATFHFEPDGWPSTCVPKKHVHDLALDDPFDVSSCTCLQDQAELMSFSGDRW
ncbi:hypothetical protein U9M48_040861 [Paspalum notatum var. saurae]|uniref:F-box domain-containing protein n=1 Tax=Paspalum notatum var. saurae TaxID=547442 RepID=A0AAQ3UN09_PASNO